MNGEPRPVSYAELAAAEHTVTADEAVALALAAAEQLGAREVTDELPASNDILLSGESVSFRAGYTARRDTAIDDNPTAWLATLLHELLALDANEPGARRSSVPGGLLVMLARATRRIDLPPPTYAALLDGLRRFGGSDPAVLERIYQAHAPAPIGAHTAGAVVLGGRQRYAVARTALRGAAAALGGIAAGLTLGFMLFSQPADKTRAADAAVTGAADRTAHRANAAPQGPALARSAAASTATSTAGSMPPSTAPAPTTARVSGPASARVRANAFSPSFASGGRELLFHAGREPGVMMRASLDDRGIVRDVSALPQETGANYHVTLSRDGGWLAFDSDRDGTRGVYVARADGRGARRISGNGYAAVPSWSPDGRHIAFIRTEPGRASVWNIWLADLADGTLRRLTQHTRGQPWGASWFPDGEHVAYSLEDALVIANLRDGSASRVPSPRRGGLVRTPAVSPDGTYVIFQVYRDGIWLLDVRTREQRRILDDPTAEEFAWSPDGRRVAFHAYRNGTWTLWQSAIDPAAAMVSAPTPMFPNG